MSCDSTTTATVVALLFDGAPRPASMAPPGDASSPAGDSLAAMLPAESLDASAQSTVPVPPQRAVYHPPYRRTNCGACHVGNQGSQLVEPPPGLCLRCHDDPAAPLAFVHGPVAVGACITCHHPHLSPSANLLRQSGQALCLSCHQRSDIMRRKAHRTIGQVSCMRCHSGHGGDNRFFLLMEENTEAATWTIGR